MQSNRKVRDLIFTVASSPVASFQASRVTSVSLISLSHHNDNLSLNAILGPKYSLPPRSEPCRKFSPCCQNFFCGGYSIATFTWETEEQ